MFKDDKLEEEFGNLSTSVCGS